MSFEAPSASLCSAASLPGTGAPACNACPMPLPLRCMPLPLWNASPPALFLLILTLGKAPSTAWRLSTSVSDPLHWDPGPPRATSVSPGWQHLQTTPCLLRGIPSGTAVLRALERGTQEGGTHPYQEARCEAWWPKEPLPVNWGPWRAQQQNQVGSCVRGPGLSLCRLHPISQAWSCPLYRCGN